jgi:small subunit ribosomal protein S8
LEKEGFVESVVIENGDHFDKVRIGLKYHSITGTKKLPVIKGIKRISKEGQRIYLKSKDIRSVKNNYGIAIVSTSRGVMTGSESQKLGLGGEYICQVW